MLHKQHLSNLSSKILSFIKKKKKKLNIKNKKTTGDRCVCFGFDFSQALSVGETVFTTQETEVKPDC